MRISDWSSDVCSSDLRAASIIGMMDEARKTRATYIGYSSGLVKGPCLSKSAESVSQSQRAIQTNISQYRKRCRRIAHMEHDRSEERRVGKERVSTCRCRCAAKP